MVIYIRNSMVVHTHTHKKIRMSTTRYTQFVKQMQCLRPRVHQAARFEDTHGTVVWLWPYANSTTWHIDGQRRATVKKRAAEATLGKVHIDNRSSRIIM